MISKNRMVQLTHEQNKLKPLRPSLREKKRYMQYKVAGIKNMTAKDMAQLIDKAIMQYLGEFGYAKAGIKHLLNKSNEQNLTGMFRLSRAMQEQVESALTLVTSYKDQNCRIEVTQTSGILKKITHGGK